MIKDEIVEETRRLRDEFAAQFNYDIRAMFEYLHEQQKTSGREYVSFSDKKSSGKKKSAKKINDSKKAA